ncbi:efflux RND transporter permease subunit [Alkalicaulis satelles]|uniref:Efflux RND transporter permease subunit n=1 Tax=Alkalicaulis satelles TaxID=2609175 RepID=A0A5M6ZCV7_9PROT|nr:efflux RND transporter permease subunit [Alkalicaulis satelles]KAA5801667.1 efflux RND transporter permease subunit [Alkalicaulis satelles]
MTTLFFRYPRLIVLALFLVVAAGLAALSVLGRQEDPSLTERFGAVTVILPGADAARMEALVTRPLEAALLELMELDEVRSTTRANVSQLNINIRPDLSPIRVEQAWSLVRDRVAEVRPSLPDGVQMVEVNRQYMGAATLIVALRWPEGSEGSLGALSRLARDLEDNLRNLPGTKETAVFGEPEEEVRVVLDPEAAAALGLTAADVAGLLARSDAKVPSGRLAGRSLDVTVEVAGAFDSLDRLRAAPVSAGPGGFLQLADIARIERGLREPEATLALRNNNRTILVAAYLEPSLQVDAWDRRAQSAVGAFADANPGLETDIIFAQADYVVDRLSGLARNLGFSALIVFAVLFLLMGWRSALIVGSALPLTVLLVMVLINVYGSPLHQMSVTGLVVALGLLIDNAIVVVDDYRLLRARGMDRTQAVDKAARTLFGPLLASTLTTIFAFAPIALMPGVAGEFISMIGVSVIFAVGSSFVLAFTVILGLAVVFDDTGAGQGYRGFLRDGLRSRPLAWAYRKLLDAVIAQPVLGVALSLILPVAGFAAATTLPSQFFPPTERDMFQVRLVLPASVSIEQTRSRVEQATEMLLAYDGVEDVVWVAGAGAPRVYYNMMNVVQGRPNFASGFVRADSKETAARVVRDFQRAAITAFPDAQVLAIPFEQGPPSPAPVELLVVGPDFAVLDRIGTDIRRILSGVPGVTFTQAGLELGLPVARLETDEAEVGLAGLRLTDLAGRLRADIDGVPGGSVLEGVEELPVRVIAPDVRRDAIEGLGATPLPGRGGAPVGISTLGRFTLAPETAAITRQDGERTNPVYAFLEPYVLPAPVLAEFQRRFEAEGITLPPGYRIEIGGEAENQGEAMADLMSTAIPLLILIIASVVLAFNSFRYAGVIFAAGFLSVGLAMFGVWMFGTPLGFNAIVGSLGLVGLSINGSIVVLSALRANHLARAGDPDAIRETVVDATRHIVATTLTTIGGFAPLLIEGDAFWLPFAAAVAGGVAGSALLALIFAPAAFTLLVRFDRKARAGEPAAPVTA